jgi:hypothetical protein
MANTARWPMTASEPARSFVVAVETLQEQKQEQQEQGEQGRSKEQQGPAHTAINSELDVC